MGEGKWPGDKAKTMPCTHKLVPIDATLQPV